MKKTPQEVRQAVVDILRRSPHLKDPPDPANIVRYQRQLDAFVEDGFMGITIDLGNDWTTWGNKCTLSINQHCEPSISWSSTSRSPAMARVAVKLYTEACDLADQIQAILDCTTVKWCAFAPGKESWKRQGNYFTAEELNSIHATNDMAVCQPADSVLSAD